MHWSGKSALIRGGVSGAGFVIARAFSQAGIGRVLKRRVSLAAWPEDGPPDRGLLIERPRRAANRKATVRRAIIKADLT